MSEHLHGWRAVQSEVGNRGIGRLLRRAQPESPAASMLERLGRGQDLDPAARARMEATFGTDLSHVRVHPEGDDPALADDPATRAATVGDHIAFAPGEYQPGTPEGDALLAHELAHVQQQTAGGDTAEQAGDAVEQDATRSAAAVMGRLWGQAIGFAQAIAVNARPRLRTGVALHRCVGKVEKHEPPAYLGPASRATLERIQEIDRSIDLVSVLVVVGVATTAADRETAAAEVAGGATTLQQLPETAKSLVIIKGHLIEREIDFLMLDEARNRVELNDEEKAFWRRVRRGVSEMRSRVQ